jgi:hypothetical protein
MAEAGVSDALIAKMRARIAQCRRLAGDVMDDKARAALLKMASEIEADMLRLETERDGPRDRPTPISS